MIDSIANTANVISRFLSSQVGYDIGSYCRLETALDHETFITNEGGLATFMAMHGVRGYADNEEAETALSGFHDAIKSALRNGDHTIHILFTQDHEVAHEFVRESMEPTYATLRRLQLDSLSDLIDSDVDAMARQVAAEWCFLAIYTHPTALDKKDIKRSADERLEYIRNNNVPGLLDCQNPFGIEMDLCNPHGALIKNLARTMAMRGTLVQILDPHEALLQIRKEIDPRMTSDDWRPALVTDLLKGKYPAGFASATKANDKSHLFPAPLPIQLAAFDHELVRNTKLPGGDVVKIGGRYYCPIVMEKAPDNIEGFEALLNQVNLGVPFRISYEIRRGGLRMEIGRGVV